MPERRTIGRRFIDLRPDAPIPTYPAELERRRCSRRDGDRPPPNNREGRRRVPLLFCATWSCSWCDRKLSIRNNIAHGARRHIVVEPPENLACDCHESRLQGEVVRLSWRFQSGNES